MRSSGRLANLSCAVLLQTALLAPAALAQSCEAEWRASALTNYTSYPEPGSEECILYNGCEWAGQFYGLPTTQTREWVAAHNIAAVHEKDWEALGMKVLQLRQGDRQIEVLVIDICADADCGGCCTRNLSGDGFLIDLERATMARFGSGDGVVEFRVCPGSPDG